MSTVEQAIARSVSNNEIVTLSVEASERAEVETDLLVECDDHAEGNDVHEYWGTTDAGHEWRVHVVRA